MYIKRACCRMKKMQKNTWKFVSMCFMMSYFCLILAIIVLITNDINGNLTVIRYALEIASVSQSIMIVCAIGSVAIEEITLHKR